MPNDLKGEIHSNFSSAPSTWSNFRSEVTGAYILSGQGGVVGRQHLLREFNRKIDNLGQSGQFYLEPYNAGFSYMGTPDLYTGAAGAYSTRTVGFGGPLMRVGQESIKQEVEEVDVRGDINGNVSFNSPLLTTGTRPTWTGTQTVYSYEAAISGKKYEVTYLKDVTFRDISGYYLDGGYEANITFINGTFVDLFSGQQPDLDNAYIHYPVTFLSNFFGDYLITFRPDLYGTTTEYDAPGLGIGPTLMNWVIGVQPVYDTLGDWIYDGLRPANREVRCSIWYDQSATGNAQNNLTQTTRADQPILCSEGVLKVDSSGNTALDFDGSAHHMVLDTGFSSTINISGLSSYNVFQADTTAGVQMIAALGSNADSDKRWYCPLLTAGEFRYAYGPNNPISEASGPANTNLNLATLVADQTQGSAKAFLNGSQIGGTATLDNQGGGTTLVGVGAMADEYHFNGKMGEFIFYTGQSVSVNRQSIETDINQHFKIY